MAAVQTHAEAGRAVGLPGVVHADTRGVDQRHDLHRADVGRQLIEGGRLRAGSPPSQPATGPEQPVVPVHRSGSPSHPWGPGGIMELRLEGNYLHLDEHRRMFGDADRDRLADLARRYAEATGKIRYPARLPALGDALFRWLDGEEGWGEILLERGHGEVLHVRAPFGESQLLDAPWELLRDPSLPTRRDAPLSDPGFLVRKLGLWPVRHALRGRLTPRAPSEHALSVLFMAAAPEGTTRLDFEAEENAILDAAGATRVDLVVEDTGTATELGRRLQDLAPIDVLHLSCHGTADGEPVLVLEDELGDPAPTTAKELAIALGSTRRQLGLCVVSACQSATSTPLGSVVRGLLDKNVPAVLGWAASVADGEATQLAAGLYKELAAASELSEALREAVTAHLEAQEDSTEWHLLRLTLGSTAPEGPLCARAGEPRFRETVSRKRWLGDNRSVPVAGARQFVGRRRPLQRALRALRGGQHVGVVLTGMGQLGKSSLAARLADRLVADVKPFTVAVCHGELELDARSVLERVGEALGDKTWSDTWRPGWQVDALGVLEDALREAAGRHRLLLVLDDLEQVLDGTASPVRAKGDFGTVLVAAVRAFVAGGRGRLLVTSRFDPHLPGVDHHLHREALAGMKPGERRRLGGVRGGAEGAARRHTRCLVSGRGNPGLTTRLLGLAGTEPRAADRVLDQLEAKDLSGLEDDQIVHFFSHVALEALVGLLSLEERAVAEACALYAASVPRRALAASGEMSRRPLDQRLRGLLHSSVT